MLFTWQEDQSIPYIVMMIVPTKLYACVMPMLKFAFQMTRLDPYLGLSKHLNYGSPLLSILQPHFDKIYLNAWNNAIDMHLKCIIFPYCQGELTTPYFIIMICRWMYGMNAYIPANKASPWQPKTSLGPTDATGRMCPRAGLSETYFKQPLYPSH